MTKVNNKLAITLPEPKVLFNLSDTSDCSNYGIVIHKRET
jgi:hypothetical protein